MTPRELDGLLGPEVVAVRIAGRDWPAGRLRPAVVPDSWIGLVASRTGRRRFVASGENPRAAAGEEILLVRNRPIEAPLSVADELAGDGLLVSGTCVALVRWAAREDDLDALRRWMPGAALRLDDLARAVSSSGGRGALRALIRANPAAALLRADQREGLMALLNEYLKRWLFESGGALEHVAQVVFRSEELERSLSRQRETTERLAQVSARREIEHAAAEAANSRLEMLASLSEKLKGLTQSGVGTWSEVLAALGPHERGKLLANLWRISGPEEASAAVAAVCADHVVLLDARSGEIAKQVSLPTALGALRSVRFEAATDRLLVGAARGVWVLDAATLESPLGYEARIARPVRTGFNSVAISGDWLVATHSQLGCWRWRLGDPGSGLAVLEAGGGQSIRAAVTGRDGRVFFSVDDFVYGLDVDRGAAHTLVGVGDEILAMALDGEQFLAGTRDGRVVIGRLSSHQALDTLHRARLPIESVSVRRFNEVREVVLPAGPQGVIAVHGEDGIITPLMNGASVRKAWAGPGVILALSEGRDRLLVSNASCPTPVEVCLSRRLGASIQDAAFVCRGGKSDNA